MIRRNRGDATAISGQPCKLNVLFIVSHFALFRIFPPSSSLSLFFFSLLSPRAYTAKIALFLYNAHIRRSYCNLVRSRFRVIGEEKYFHGYGAPTKERERVLSLLSHLSLSLPLFLSFSLENLPRSRKSRATINSLLKRNRSPPF